MRNLDVTFTYTINGSEEKEFNTDLTGSETAEEIIEAIIEAQNEQLSEENPEEEKEYTAEMVELTGVTSSEEVHNDYLSIETDKKNIFDYAEYFCECDQDADVVNAAIDCDIQGSDIDEAYNGSYKDDEDFAQETAESIGAIDKEAGWPNNCIDWERAARELMYDYSESNGHYFRNF